MAASMAIDSVEPPPCGVTMQTKRLKPGVANAETLVLLIPAQKPCSVQGYLLLVKPKSFQSFILMKKSNPA